MNAGAVALAWSLAALVLTTRGDIDVVESEVAHHSGRENALAKLHEVFGLRSRNARPHRRHEVPPQFMTELYNAVAEPSGLTKGSNPYNAKIVRSFIERDNSKEQFFIFNISGLDREEYVLEAELHIYRMRAPINEDHRFFASSPDCLVHVYQVIDDQALSQPDVQRLLSVHYISLSSSGWLVANVKQAVLDWISKKSPNLGLLVVATSLFGEPVRLNFTRRNQHHNSKQPILVLFDDDRPRPILEDSNLPSGRNISVSEPSLTDNELAAGHRSRRSLPTNSTINHHVQPPVADINSTNSNEMPDECSKHPLYVNFSKIGWDSWIVAPAGYMAYQCKGHCDFPLGQGQAPTNHATVQSIVHELKLIDGVNKPCCVPTALVAASMLFFDDDMNLVLKNYEDMVAESCGCH